MTSKRLTANLRRTAGFTLVELLVVFAIIAILAALTATAVFKVISVQQSNNTQLTIKTLSSLLDKNWAAVIRDHQTDRIPDSVMAIAGFEERRARVIWIKLNLKKEFPMNLTEAVNPVSLPSAIVNLAPPNSLLRQFLIPAVDVQGLGPKPAYIAAITRATQIQGAVINANSTDLDAWPLESSFTLVMDLQQNRAGSAFAEESFTANALATEIFKWGGSPPQAIQPALLVGPKMVVDAWTTPLVLYRWPVGNTDFQTMNTKTTYPDPLDPQGTLMDPRWNNYANWTALQGVWWFEKYCHSVHQGNTQTMYKPFACYTEPTIVSAGPDHILGIQPAAALINFSGSTVGPAPNLPDEMNVNTGTNSAWFDNIASYKLRTGGTGDK
jgi:prepilin-type N-terminal cleavage/methylation domain-containing protein